MLRVSRCCDVRDIDVLKAQANGRRNANPKLIAEVAMT
jgi:hypothetical protein